MNFELNETQQLFQATLARGLRDGLSDRALAELGVYALMLDTQHGGLDGNSIDAMVVAETFGRAVFANRFIDTCIITAEVIAALGSEEQKALWLPQIAEGRLNVALAIAQADTLSLNARGRLSGRHDIVIGLPGAQRLLIAASDQNAVTLLLLDPQAAGIEVRDYLAIDGSPAAIVVFDDVDAAAAIVGARGRAQLALDQAVERGLTAQCAEAVGLMATLIDATITQLNTRHQFGVALASFQALQHRLADMYMAYSLARSICIKASILCGQAPGAERSLAVSAAKIEVARAAQLIGHEAIQMHGAMGMTAELNVGHAVKRLRALAIRLGTADDHLRRYDSLRREARAA